MSNPADIQPQPVDLGACTDLELLAAILAELRALRAEVTAMRSAVRVMGGQL